MINDKYLDDVISDVGIDITEKHKKISKKVDLVPNNSGYVLAYSKSDNPQNKTVKEIEEYNALETYYKNLINVKNILNNIFGKKGRGITLFNNPHQLLDRLELLGGSILAGNNGVIPEFSKIAHLLNQMKVITKKQLNDLLKTYITIR